MLKSWSIENFKPIVNSGEIKLAPVTVLAGMNSSGKSSFLQSILMISQTLSSRVLDRPLLPNGPIVQLGTFENIRNEKSRSRMLTVSFELETERRDSEIFLKEDPPENTIVAETEKAKVMVKFISATDEIVSSAIEAARVSVESVLIETEDLLQVDKQGPILAASHYTFLINKLTSTQLKTFLKDVSPEFLSQIPYAEEEANYLGKIEIKLGNKVLDAQYLVVLSHFLPSKLFQKFVEEERRKSSLVYKTERFVRLLFYRPFSLKNPNYQPYITNLNLSYPISDALKNDLDDFCKRADVRLLFEGKTFLDLAEWLADLQKQRESRYIMTSARSKLQQSLLKDLYKNNTELKNKEDRHSEGLEAVNNVLNDINLYQSVEQITNFFTSKIRYLGPLRADPQASQKFAPSSELDEVGAKGEYAAAVYDANQNARIEWCNPLSMQVEQGTLKIALDSWTQYLGVANQIKIETAGQSGFSWQVVHKKDQKPLPLAAVGVGVSQVLPILVMGLLAPKNTLLIIEQPELHLHPRVQARLGDFFVGLSKCQKQCLIETHSENLVNQLRYHIVESGGQEKSNCMIYFVDQDEQGATTFEQVEISPKGNILNWPEGFFDETMHQEDKITAASIRKRNKIAQDG
jgi:predicted ATPase